jgi:hypothetical protein
MKLSDLADAVYKHTNIRVVSQRQSSVLKKLGGFNSFPFKKVTYVDMYYTFPANASIASVVSIDDSTSIPSDSDIASAASIDDSISILGMKEEKKEKFSNSLEKISFKEYISKFEYMNLSPSSPSSPEISNPLSNPLNEKESLERDTSNKDEFIAATDNAAQPEAEQTKGDSK